MDNGDDIVTASIITFFTPLIEVEDHTVIDPVVKGNESMSTKTGALFDPSDGLLHLVTDFPAPTITQEKCQYCGMKVRNMSVHMKLNHKKKFSGFTGSNQPQQTKGRKRTSLKLPKVPRPESTQD